MSKSTNPHAREQRRVIIGAPLRRIQELYGSFPHDPDFRWSSCLNSVGERYLRLVDAEIRRFIETYDRVQLARFAATYPFPAFLAPAARAMMADLRARASGELHEGTEVVTIADIRAVLADLEEGQ